MEYADKVIEPKKVRLTPIVLTGTIVFAVVLGAVWKGMVEPILMKEPHHLVNQYQEQYPICTEGEFLWWDDLRNSWVCAVEKARRQPDFTMAELPVNCDPGRLFWVTDGVDRADCTYGGGAGEHWCICTSEGTWGALVHLY
jgi:hypothetical protein